MDRHIDPRPVYEEDQVATVENLYAIRNGYVNQFDTTSRFRFIKRYQYLVAIGVLNSVMTWVLHGKPADGRVNCEHK